MKRFMTLFLIVFSISVLANNSTNQLQAQSDNIGINFSGFVKTDVMFDTRQSVAPREGHFYLWPKNEELDANGKDINERANLNILSVQTRLQSKITGPDVFGAKSSGYLEGEFFGTTDGNVNTFRLRHAFVDLDWATTKLRAGQFWHPLFATDCFAGTISFNTGVPFQPFSRNPQVRLVQKLGDLSVTLAAVSQRDFTNAGPEGFTSSYLRNSAVPEMYFGLQYNFDKHVIGAGGSYKILAPRLNTTGIDNKKYKAEETLGTYAANAYLKLSFDKFLFKAFGVYGQNMEHLMLPSGYAVKSIDAVTGAETYTPFNNLSAWADISYGKELEVGVFAGYGKVLGTQDETDIKLYFGRGTDISTLMRVSPRIAYTFGKFRTAFELEYTAAEFGNNDVTDKNKVIDTKSVANIRGLLAFYIFF